MGIPQSYAEFTKIANEIYLYFNYIHTVIYIVWMYAMTVFAITFIKELRIRRKRSKHDINYTVKAGDLLYFKPLAYANIANGMAYLFKINENGSSNWLIFLLCVGSAALLLLFSKLLDRRIKVDNENRLIEFLKSVSSLREASKYKS